jgi:hypothetical protein
LGASRLGRASGLDTANFGPLERPREQQRMIVSLGLSPIVKFWREAEFIYNEINTDK